MVRAASASGAEGDGAVGPLAGGALEADANGELPSAVAVTAGGSGAAHAGITSHSSGATKRMPVMGCHMLETSDVRMVAPWSASATDGASVKAPRSAEGFPGRRDRRAVQRSAS